MGKDGGFLTPKAIANRIKSKGLQKLKFFCQMCQKQCRDENGFKCHLTSDGHQRQMAIFGSNQTKFIDEYSREFESAFLEHMRNCHRFSRCSANVVYNEYITDRLHVHMNSTKWLTLTEFIKYLGREGKLTVEETDRGLFITYIDRDPERIMKQEQRAKRERSVLSSEERRMKNIQALVDKTREEEGGGGGGATHHATALTRSNAETKIAFGFGGGEGGGEGAPSSAHDIRVIGGPHNEKKSSNLSSPPPLFSEDTLPPNKKTRVGGGSMTPPPASAAATIVKKTSSSSGTKKSALESLMQEDEAHRERVNRKDYWLFEGITVKILARELKEAGMYKKKGVVRRIIDTYVGEVEVAETGDIVRVDQEKLETVLPKPGGTVKIVNGAYRGERGVLTALHEDRFKASVRVVGGCFNGKQVTLEYEDVCKYLM